MRSPALIAVFLEGQVQVGHRLQVPVNREVVDLLPVPVQACMVKMRPKGKEQREPQSRMRHQLSSSHKQQSSRLLCPT